MAVAYVPMIVITGFWGIVGIILPLIVPKGPNRGVIRAMLMLTAVCCWLFWLCAYLCQINPLFGPALHTETLAILQREWPYQAPKE
ncbi:hypothetical protein CHUAL_006037 [Chamberlinius hualienensis]